VMPQLLHYLRVDRNTDVATVPGEELASPINSLGDVSEEI